MKQKRMDNWKRIRSVGKWRFVFAYCCIFYCLVTIVITLRRLWPDGKFINFGDFLTKVIIIFVLGFFAALTTWNINEEKLKKANDDDGRA